MPLIRLIATDLPPKNSYPVLFNTAHITHAMPHSQYKDITFVQMLKGHFHLAMPFVKLVGLLDRVEAVWLIGDGDPVPVANNLIRFVPSSPTGEEIIKGSDA